MAKSIKYENGIYLHPSAIEQNIITVVATNDQVITDTNSHTIMFNSTLKKIGSKLTLNNNKIRIGKGINYVLASCTIWVENNSGYAWLSLYKNSSQMATAMKPVKSTESWGTLTIAPVLIEVKEGDTISCSLFFNVTDSSYNKLAGSYNNSVQMTVIAVG